MGKVKLDPRDEVPDFGSVYGRFERQSQFMKRFYELWLLQQRIGCVSVDDGSNSQTATCKVSSTVEIEVRGWPTTRNVTISWTGDLDKTVERNFIDLYVPGDRQEIIESFALSTGIPGNRYRDFKAGWVSGTHSFEKKDQESPVQHSLSIFGP
ncbi:hypothetical protein ASG68_25485 [Rhizobium sp. Leaf453]|nr:hypothetical protein ASG68_25485 [Rhizobium sp. Leaf453]